MDISITTFSVSIYRKSTRQLNFLLLSYLEVSFVLRKAGASSTTNIEIFKEGDTCRWKYKIAFKSGDLSFKIGETFSETTPDGRKVKVIKMSDWIILVSSLTIDRSLCQFSLMMQNYYYLDLIIASAAALIQTKQNWILNIICVFRVANRLLQYLHILTLLCTWLNVFGTKIVDNWWITYACQWRDHQLSATCASNTLSLLLLQTISGFMLRLFVYRAQ